MSYSSKLLPICVVVLLTTVASAADPLSWLPADVNAVARINVAEIYKTPLAKKEGWLKQTTESFIHQEAFVPPGTSQIFLAAQLDLTDQLASHRQCGILVPEAQTKLEKIVDYLPGGIETIGGKPGAQFGHDGYVVDAGDGCWLTVNNSNRQYLARWLKSGPTKGDGQLTPYLRSALTTKSNKAQLILAIDLQDNFSKEKIAGNLKATDWLPSESAADAIADILASAYGITIGVEFDKERTGIVTLDFGKDAASLKPILDKLVDAILQRIGATNEDFTDWKWTVKGSRVTGTGPVSPGGGRRMLSIIEPPAITQALSESQSPPPDNKMAKTSQKYCKSLRVLLDDLRKTIRETKDNHALWLERYARKIDDMPRLNVDPELLGYAASVSSSLRYQGQTTRTQKIHAGTQIAQTVAYTPTWGGYVGPYGGWAAWNQSPGILVDGAINQEANEQIKTVRFSEWKQIEDGLRDMRTKLTDRYQIEF